MSADTMLCGVCSAEIPNIVSMLCEDCQATHCHECHYQLDECDCYPAALMMGEEDLPTHDGMLDDYFGL